MLKERYFNNEKFRGKSGTVNRKTNYGKISTFKHENYRYGQSDIFNMENFMEGSVFLTQKSIYPCGIIYSKLFMQGALFPS